MEKDLFEPVTKEQIITTGFLGSILLPLSISRWVIFRKLTWKERFRVLFGGTVFVTEYSTEGSDERTYTLNV